MMRQRFLSAALVAPLLLLTACGVENLLMPTKGKLAISVDWPKKAAYTLKTIPEGTTRIEVTILGQGIPGNAPLHTTLTPTGNEGTTDFLEVPIGPKVVQAVAFDALDHEVAFGEKPINVEPNKLTEAHVDLKPEPLTIEPSTSPSPSPDGSPRPSASPTATPTPGPVIDTVAGGNEKLSLDSQDPRTARFFYPRSLAFDYGAQVLYIADNDNHLIRKYDAVSHAVTTVAYLGAPATSDTPAATAALGSAFGLAVGNDGALYYADAEHNVIKRLRRNGDSETIAGTGSIGADDGPAASATFRSPVDLAFGPDGKLYVADQLNNRIRAIDLTKPGMPVTTVAGTGADVFSGDAGPAEKAAVGLPTAIAISPSGALLYVAEGKSLRVRKINLGTGIIDSVAGTGTTSTAGEGGPALKASLSLPLDLAFDLAGNLIIADGWAGHLGNGTAFVNGSASRILRIGQDGKLVRIAGELRSANGFSGDGGDPTRADLNNPSGLAFDSQGALYIADTNNARIRTIVLPPAPPTPAPTEAPTPGPTDAPTPAPGS